MGGPSRFGPRRHPVPKEDEARIVEIVESAFQREIARSKRFELVADEGPDVLTLHGRLIDVVSYVDADRPDRGDLVLESVGEATLVMELRDSLSQAALARIVDRQAGDRMSPVARSRGSATRASLDTWKEVERVAAQWALRVRMGLDEAPNWSLGN